MAGTARGDGPDPRRARGGGVGAGLAENGLGGGAGAGGGVLARGRLAPGAAASHSEGRSQRSPFDL